MKSVNYDVKCLMCAAEAGQIMFGRFVPRPAGRASAPHQVGMLRCRHCGGSLLLEPSDIYPSALPRVELADLVAAGAVRQPAPSRPGSQSLGETA